ncbi:hypothetical protein D9M68_565780 [compost metagenome]|jgi:3-phenylpropionate/trans-cinnamate dioxygenase ferredoxin subunit
MFVALERRFDLEGGHRSAFQEKGRYLLRIVVDQRSILMENRCPRRGLHADSPEQGRCSRHGIAFDLTNGRPLNASCPPLQRLPLAFHGDRIGLDL